MFQTRDDRSTAAGITRRAALRQVGGLGVALAGGAHLSRSSVAAQATPTADATPVAGGAPTVVFVHGAFADSTSWSGVISLLQADDTPVLAVANPLRGIAADSAYVAGIVRSIPGSVLLVGHSYGGAVITNVGAQVENAVGLVYVAALAPAAGETIGEVSANYPDLGLGGALIPAFAPESEAELELMVDPAQWGEIFAADLPAEVNAIAAVSQRPLVASALAEPSEAAAWETLPSWFVVATQDRAINPDQERFYAERAGSTTVEVDASHLVLVSQPEAVADLIRTALASLA